MSSAAKKAYFAFGRFQPPTKGHELLISTVANKAADDGADAYIFTSNTCDAKQRICRNPLSANIKVSYMEKMFSHMPITIINGGRVGANNPFAAFTYLLNKGYEDVTLFAGSDRYESYMKAIERIGKPGLHVEPVGGVRDENAEGVEGISGTKARALALLNNIESFSLITKMGSMKNSNVMSLRENIRSSMIAPSVTAEKVSGSFQGPVTRKRRRSHSASKTRKRPRSKSS